MKTLRAVLLDVLLVVMIVLLISLVGVIFKLSNLLDTTTVTMQSLQQLAQQSQVRVVGTSQNLNASLIQLGLTLDNVRRASESQDQVARKTLAILDNTNEVLLQAHSTLEHIDSESTATLGTLRGSLDSATLAIDSSRETIQHIDKVVSDPTIPKTLESVNTSAANVAKATTELSATSETIHQKVEQLAKPVSLMKQILSRALGLAAQLKTMFFQK